MFADGGSLETDVIVFSAGIRPRDELARACGLEVGAARRHRDRRRLPHQRRTIYAIGECAAWNGKIFGLVAPGYEMARIAAARVLGDAERSFAGADMSTKLKLMGVDVASIGDAHGATPGARAYPFVDERTRGLQEDSWSTPTASSCSAPCWSATPPTTALWLQMMLNGIALPDEPGSS